MLGQSIPIIAFLTQEFPFASFPLDNSSLMKFFLLSMFLSQAKAPGSSMFCCYCWFFCSFIFLFVINFLIKCWLLSMKHLMPLKNILFFQTESILTFLRQPMREQITVFNQGISWFKDVVTFDEALCTSLCPQLFKLALRDLYLEPLSAHKMLSFPANQEIPLLSPVHPYNCIDFQLIF